MGRRPKLPEQQSAIVNRLRSAEGHLHAIIGMVESGEPCEQVLHQLDAVESALKAAGRALRYCQFRQSIEMIRHGSDAETRIAELERLAALYGLRAQPPTLSSERTTR